jgi:hypothetical protein
MKYFILSCFVLFSSLFVSAKEKDTIPESEGVFVEMAVNVSYYNSLSISIEKEFTYGKFKFGPRAELVNLFTIENYKGGDSIYQMNTQFRLRLAQVEYQLNDKIRVGIAPFWLLGPLPKNGYYKTPTTIYAHIQLKEGFSFEPSITSSSRELIQLSFRKMI